MEQEKKGVILIVDDDPLVLSATAALLDGQGYSVATCNDPRNAINTMQIELFDIVLSDIKMPHITGVELLGMIHKLYPAIPVILMTAEAELDSAIDAIREGAFDFIIKPYRGEYLFITIEKALRYKRTIELEKNYKTLLEELVNERTRKLNDALKALKESSLETIRRLTTVAEYRDTDTGVHIARIGFYSQKIAEAMNIPQDFVEAIGQTSMMHDIGKIGIPDEILLKTGSLTAKEFEIIKSHTTIGYKMLAGSSHPNIQMAACIALYHHEKWNGGGYPKGLKGEKIPIEGRIVMICDVYDALMSKRPYKPPLEHKQAYEIITKGDGRTLPDDFDPKVMRAFKEVAPAFEEIFSTHQDIPSFTQKKNNKGE
ncbi:MAG: response regulator [Deltaproteobacteria bacterium]|nr:response regulator [Deltaproteobacteria bacterium]